MQRRQSQPTLASRRCMVRNIRRLKWDSRKFGSASALLRVLVQGLVAEVVQPGAEWLELEKGLEQDATRLMLVMAPTKQGLAVKQVS